MNENLFEAKYDVTKKSRLVHFYESNKVLIFSSIFVLFTTFIGINFYLDSKEKKRLLLSENYLEAKVYLESGDKDKATEILKKVVFSNDKTYSTLSLFLIVNQNLVSGSNELLDLFEHLLSNNQFSNEERNLLIYKKTLLNSNSIEESELLNSLKPLLHEDTYWKPHALILLGDYFVSRGDKIKAIEFYTKIFSISNLHNDIYISPYIQKR